MPSNLIIGAGHKFSRPRNNTAEVVADERAAAQEAVPLDNFDPLQVPHMPDAEVAQGVTIPVASNATITRVANNLQLLELENQQHKHFQDAEDENEIGNHGFSEKQRKKKLKKAQKEREKVREDLQRLHTKKLDNDYGLSDNWEGDDEEEYERLTERKDSLANTIRILGVPDRDAFDDD